MDKKPLQMQIFIQANASRVFHALTEPDALRSWLAEDADVDLQGGRYCLWGKFTPRTPALQDDHMRLLDFEIDRLLKFSWTMGQNPSTVIFKLSEAERQSVLTLIHRRHENRQPDDFSLEDFWFVHLENLRRYLDGKSSEARVDFSRPMTGDIRHELDCLATPQMVYAVLTNPQWMERWIASKAAVELHPGGKYDLGWGIEGIRVLDFKENKRLTISWQEQDEAPTHASWHLQAVGAGKTRIKFEHTGFDADFPNNGIWLGWLNYLNWIRSLAEYGASWHPPAIALTGHPYADIYPKSMHELQAILVHSEFELE